MNLGQRTMKIACDWISIQHDAIILFAFLADKDQILHNSLNGAGYLV